MKDKQADVLIIGAGAAGMMCALTARTAGPVSAVARSFMQACGEDTHFRRRAMQLYQPQCQTGKLSFAEPAFLPVCFGPFYAATLHCYAQ